MIDPHTQPDSPSHTRLGTRPNGEGVLIHAAEAVTSAALARLAPSEVQPTHPAPPSGAVLHPQVHPEPGHRDWFLIQFGNELRLAARMYFDPHYRISRTAQFLLPLILGLFVFDYFFFAVWFAVPVISPVLERAACVLLGIFSYKVLSREVARYREVLDYLAKYGTR